MTISLYLYLISHKHKHTYIHIYIHTYSRIILKLSNGGADATVCREFDILEKSFVKDGFCLEEAKSYVSWKDLDTLLVGTGT